MGRGRSKPAIACALGTLTVALLGAGCGKEEHANDPRPQTPIEVTASISQKKVSVQPAAVGGAEDGQQPISQNEGETDPELPSNTPLTVVITVANLTDTDTHLEIAGPKDATSNLIVAGGTTNYKVDLPTGDYRVAAADIPGATAARFNVGPARFSSQNDLLLP
jgi:hypothetical protein